MRFIVAFIIVMLNFSGRISAQEHNTLVDTLTVTDGIKEFPEYSGRQISPGAATMPDLFLDLTNNFDLPKPTLPVINFNLTNGWKTETGTFSGFRSINGFPFVNNPIGLYGRSAWDIFKGIYGIRTYQVNNKLYIGTAGYSDRSFNEYSLKSGIYRQTNYGSSLFVGYKFSDKFSISASFTIRRNGDPFNGNQGMQSGSIFP